MMKLVDELLSYLGLGRLASLKGKGLTITQKCLAHLQASAIISDIERRFLYEMPYHAFSSRSLLTVGDSLTRDYRPGEASGLMTMFPLQLRKAKGGERVVGTVLRVWEGKNPTGPEYGGSYLEEGAQETLDGGSYLEEGAQETLVFREDLEDEN